MFRKIFLILFTSILIHAETLYYKENGSVISPQEHQIIYKIMLENQFPMSIAYGSYIPNEIQAINDKIKKQLPNSGIKASFIPTTLYELFILNFIRENADNIEQASKGAIEFYSKTRKNLVSYPSNDIEPKHFKDANLEPAVRDFHLIINNYILDVLNKNKLPIPHSVVDALKILNTINFWQLLKVSNNGFHYGKDGKNLLNPTDMKRAIEIEYQADSADKFVLYRGANVIDDEKDPHTSAEDAITKRLNRSISFGSTLLGGIFQDDGACAYCYMAENEAKPVRSAGYALLINKKEYAQGPLSNMFYIPSLISILDLLGRGEFFHSRSKVPDLLNVNKISFVKSAENLTPYIDYYQIVAPTAEKAQEIYSKTLQYIKENHIILKQR